MPKLYLRLCLFFVAIVFSVGSYGQKMFTKSYIVLANNDTLKGYIEERPSYSKNKAISFKKENINAEELSISVNDLSSFYLYDDNENYIVREVEIDKKPIESSRLERNMARKIDKERVILKTLVSGKAGLYHYVDENAKEHFFFNKDSAVIELSYVRFITQKGEISELPQFKQQLQNLFSDCEKLAKSKYTYSMSSLTKSFQEYNVCTGSVLYSKKKHKFKVIPTLQLGLAINFLDHVGTDNFNNFSGDYASYLKYTNNQNMMVGIAFDFKPKKVSNPIAINVAFDWRNAGEFTATNNVVDLTSRRKDYSISLSYLTLSGGIKYSFAKYSYLKPFVKFGLAYSYLLNNETSMTVTVFGKSTTSGPLLNLSNGGFGIVSSLGCNVKMFQFELGYNLTQFTTSNAAAILYINSPIITIGYRFAKLTSSDIQ